MKFALPLAFANLVSAGLIGKHDLIVGQTKYTLQVSEKEDTTHQNRHPVKFDFSSEKVDRPQPNFKEYIH
jgi:hypothetical protein